MLHSRYQRLLRHIVPALFLLFGCLGLTGAPPAAAAGPSQAAAAKPAGEKAYAIGLGDVIKVQVWKEPDLTETQTVRLDGRISLPLLGDVKVVDRTPGELSKKFETKLGQYITDPSVTVSLVESKSRRYYMIGQLKGAGEFPINYPITILQALARGGGFLEWAKTSRIMVVRRLPDSGETILYFNYDAFAKGKKLEQNILIQPGDTIIIP